jgi:uncharacterized protein (UPF0147 family)
VIILDELTQDQSIPDEMRAEARLMMADCRSEQDEVALLKETLRNGTTQIPPRSTGIYIHRH